MEIPHAVTARPDTGLWNAKVGIWLFLASEVMLFGGLFSSYVFLRLGADYPWPKGELQVEFGFWNTLILISSSVFVVRAWVALKMRQWPKYQFWMLLVILSAAAFLVNKGLEYTAKFHHYHATLKDGTVVSGHLDHDLGKLAKSIVFEASHVTVDGKRGSHFFLKWLENKDDIRFLTADSTEVKLTREWFEDAKEGLRLNAKAKAKARALEKSGETAAAKKLEAKVAEDYEVVGLFDEVGKLRLSLSQTGRFVIPRSKVGSWSETGLNFTKALATDLDGKLVSAELKLEIDQLDLRLYLRRDDPREKAVADAAIFKYFDDPAEGRDLLADFNHYRDPKLAAYEKAVAAWKERNPGKVFKEERFMEFDRVYLHDLHEQAHGDEGAEGQAQERHAATAEAEGHGSPRVTIPFEDVKFFSNYGPRKNTFYAIYFTMTGLHGLHVFGGMLVLGYFLLRGRRLYLRNPEHMANRVEVGGLFWHFVDLVWIFLFPVLYLM